MTVATRPVVPTFARVGGQRWGVRWPLAFGSPPEPGQLVTVAKKDGATDQVEIVKAERKYEDAIVFSIVPGKKAKREADPGLEAGAMYRLDGDVYVAARSKSTGKLYAKKLADGKLEYAGGVIFRLKPEHRIERS